MTATTRKPYLTELADEPWATVEPLLPPAKAGGHPRAVDQHHPVPQPNGLPMGYAAACSAAQEHGR